MKTLSCGLFKVKPVLPSHSLLDSLVKHLRCGVEVCGADCFGGIAKQRGDVIQVHPPDIKQVGGAIMPECVAAAAILNLFHAEVGQHVVDDTLDLAGCWE